MLQTLRHHRQFRVLVTLALLLSQCLLFVAEAAHAADAQTLPDNAHHLLLDANDTTDNHQAPASDSDTCDHCCACHGHSGHLALLIELDHQLPPHRPALLPVAPSQLTPANRNAIYRPPIV